jgi:transposase
MRGEVSGQHGMFSYVSLEQRVRADHPLRAIKLRTEAALKALNPVFTKMYAAGGRPSIAPERLLKAQLLIALFSVRSDRQFCEQLDWNLLFRWFMDMTLDEASFDASTFSKNRERLLEHDVARQFFSQVLRQAKEEKLLSAEHFSVDGTLIESLASLKSVRPKDDDGDGPIDPDNTGVDFKGQKRSNATHQSVTDPEAKLFCKGRGQAAKLYFTGHAMSEHRHGLIVDFAVTDVLAGERTIALKRVNRRRFPRLKTLSGDKGYCTRAFIAALRARGIRPHVALDERFKFPGLDWRTLRHGSYRLSQRKRKLIEQAFGWLKTVAGLRKSRFFGTARTELYGLMAMAGYNLVRMSRLRPVFT